MVKFVLFIVAIVLVIITLLGYILKSASRFFDEANEIETLIKNNGVKEDILLKIIKLNSESFNKTTHSRIKELYKMYEVKFNEKII